MMKSFRYDAHPMGMLVSTISAVSTFHPEANPALTSQHVYDVFLVPKFIKIIFSLIELDKKK